MTVPVTVTVAELLHSEPVFLNVGVPEFGDSLRKAGYEVVYVDWSPPAGGDPRLAEMLDELL